MATGGGRSHYNIVFMGMGEPLNNADRVFEAVRLLNDPDAARDRRAAHHGQHSGVVPGIDRMIDELPQVNLAISLHAATDELRDELVPINRKWPIAEVDRRRPALRGAHRRRVSLEYVLIDGLNDAEEQAAGLAELARGWRCPRQPDPAQPNAGLALERNAGRRGRAFVRPPPARVACSVTVRDTRGREIEAACGQLHAQLIGRSLRRHERRRDGPGVVSAEPQISASILNADFARLGDEVRRAANGGVDSVHLDVMDGHFVDNLTLGPVVVAGSPAA